MVQPWTYTIFSVTLDHLLIIWWTDWVSWCVDPGSVGLARYCQRRFPFSAYSQYPKMKAMAPHCSILAWKIPWTEEPGRLQSMGSRRVGHDWATSLSLFTFMHWRRNWHPTAVFLPGKFHRRRSLVGCSPWGHRVGHDRVSEQDINEGCVGYRRVFTG